MIRLVARAQSQHFEILQFKKKTFILRIRRGSFLDNNCIQMLLGCCLRMLMNLLIQNIWQMLKILFFCIVNK